jgi:transcriptional regulator with XRE-family HTH domain
MESRIKTLREQQGLPLVVAARKAGVSTLLWHTWEHWGLPPRRLEKREAIARALGVPLAEILPAEPGGQGQGVEHGPAD